MIINSVKFAYIDATNNDTSDLDDLLNELVLELEGGNCILYTAEGGDRSLEISISNNNGDYWHQYNGGEAHILDLLSVLRDFNVIDHDDSCQIFDRKVDIITVFL